MRWGHIGKYYFRWEVKAADWWLGGFGPQDKGGYRHYYITIPPLGLPLVPLHVMFAHDKPVKMPVTILNQNMRPLHAAQWSQDGPEWRKMLTEQAVTVPGGRIFRVIKSGARLDISPPCLYILVYDDRVETPAPTPVGAGEYADWEGFYNAYPQADPFGG